MGVILYTVLLIVLYIFFPGSLTSLRFFLPLVEPNGHPREILKKAKQTSKNNAQYVS